MEGGTTLHLVTGGIEEALTDPKAEEAAKFDIAPHRPIELSR
jgi:hypothetical protein